MRYYDDMRSCVARCTYTYNNVCAYTYDTYKQYISSDDKTRRVSRNSIYAVTAFLLRCAVITHRLFVIAIKYTRQEIKRGIKHRFQGRLRSGLDEFRGTLYITRASLFFRMNQSSLFCSFSLVPLVLSVHVIIYAAIGIARARQREIFDSWVWQITARDSLKCEWFSSVVFPDSQQLYKQVCIVYNERVGAERWCIYTCVCVGVIMQFWIYIILQARVML